MKPVHPPKDLSAWKQAIALAGKVYGLTRHIPHQAQNTLGEQLRRTAVAVPVSIAEGAGRHNRTEFLQFLRRASAALAELETVLLIAESQMFLQSSASALEDIAELRTLLDRLVSQVISARQDAHARACRPFQHRRLPPSSSAPSKPAADVQKRSQDIMPARDHAKAADVDSERTARLSVNCQPSTRA